MKPLKNKKESTKQRRRKLRNRLISVLTAAVVFMTTYALVLPAITMDAETANAMPGIDVAQPTTEQVAAEPIAAEPIAAEPVAAEAPAEAAPAVEPAAEATPAAPAAEAPTQVIADENVPMAAPDAAATVTPEPVKSESVVSESSTSTSSTSSSADSTEAADAAEEEKKDDTAEEKKDEEAKDEEKEDEAKLAVSPLTFDCAEYLVTVSFSEAAALPEGTTLSVREYGAGSMEYNNYHAILNQKLREDGVAEEDLTDAVSALRFYELSFINKDGAQILPASAVDVLVEYKTPTNPVADESLYAVTFRTDDGQPTKATLNTVNAADGSACVEAAGGVIQKLRVQGYAANDIHTNNAIGQLLLKQTAEETAEPEFVTTLDDEEESITTPYLTADGEAYNITMTYGPEAGIPDGAELAVSEIVEATDTYDEYVSKTEEALGENEKVTFARFFDITIMYEGAEIQPNGPVNVKIELADALTEDVKVVHFEHDDAAAETPVVLDSARVEADALENAVGFEADSFSVYGVVESELKKEITLTTPDGEDVTYVVSVTYGPEAEIPEGASLELNVVDEDTKTYKDVKDLLFSDGAEDIAEEGQNPELLLTDDSGEVPVYTYSTSDGIIRELDSQRALDVLDISIRNEEGKIVEPKDSVKVSIVMKEAPEEMTLQEIASSAVVQHLNEKSGSVVIETVATGDNSVDGTVQAIGNEVKAVFEVDSFSLYTFSYTSYGTTVSQRVHYVDENGRELPAPAVTPSQNNGHSHLIYDIDGYEYVRTTISSASGTQISPYIQAEWTGYYNPSLRWRYRTLTINANGNRTLGNWQNLTQDVYVVYRQKPTPPQGGDSVPVVPQGEWPEFPNGEKTKPTKTSVDNGDGTNTLSLTVTGAETPLTSGKVKAQVIVVFDLSGSMNYRMGSDTDPGYGERSRLSYSKEAVESLTNALGTNDKLDVEMALVTFSNYARTAMGFTNVSSATGRQSFISTVDGLSATGGTNWEAALREANYIQTKSDAKTYVIFVSDGAPTFRVSRGSYSESNINGNVNDDNAYYMSYGIFGTGSATHTEDRSFALTQATSIVNSNKTFYTVALTDANDTGHASEYMADLNTRAGGAGNYSATSPEELADVINAIGTSITTELGFADISIHDGITDLTNLNAKVIHTVDENSFKYYRYGGENNKYGTASNPSTWGNDPSDPSKLEGGANKATYDSSTGAVEWNMGSDFQLEDGVTYKVSFKVWPDQDAYDWIAKLRNGTVQYDELPADVKAQIDKNTLTLKTNTDAYVRYKKSSTTSGDTTTTGDPIQVDYNTVDPMPLPAQSIPIEKLFINELDPDRYKNEPVRISLAGDGATFAVAELNESNNFKTTAFISYGLMTPGDEPVLKEPGHDFVLTELSAYHWDLEAGVYRPMIIGGVRKLLQKVESGGDYTIDGKQYKELPDGASISATNYRRSNLNLTKNIVDKDGQTLINDKYPNQLFEYTITVNSADGEDVWFSVQTDPDDYTTVVTDLTTSAYPELDDQGNPKNNGYFYQHSGGSFTVSLKPTWNLRFTNLPKGSTYTIVESSTEGFEFDRASLNPVGDDEQFTVSKPTATVTGVVAEYSKQYQVTYTNRCTLLDIVVIKTDDKGEAIPGATFNLLKKDGSSYHAISGRDDLTNFSIPEDGITLTGLLPGDYELEEVTPPEGYIIIKKETYFNLSNSDEIIKLSEESKDIASTSGEKKDTVSIKNQAGTELPNTGGTGTLPFTLGGIGLILASALMYGFRMRRRERRLN